ncbi:MAG: VOC family protein [Sphingomonadales bacterium]|nr:VOC family protein [Sphingomonadales bacterium]MBD3773998.1 VOC family protein [Paracoccaceae bacterium]MBD3814475.1 VOC family protein [Betaproteobacteria bacterium]
MPRGYLEHANISVTDIERSAALLENLCGWHIRWRGPAQSGGETIHVGDDHAYVAVYTHPEVAGQFAKGAPLNHIGLVVDDLAAAEAVVTKVGLVPFNHSDYEPGRRFYFFDWDGIEWELVSYE